MAVTIDNDGSPSSVPFGTQILATVDTIEEAEAWLEGEAHETLNQPGMQNVWLPRLVTTEEGWAFTYRNGAYTGCRFEGTGDRPYAKGGA